MQGVNKISIAISLSLIPFIRNYLLKKQTIQVVSQMNIKPEINIRLNDIKKQ